MPVANILTKRTVWVIRHLAQPRRDHGVGRAGWDGAGATVSATVRTAGALASGGMSLHRTSTRPAAACRLPCHAEACREAGARHNRDARHRHDGPLFQEAAGRGRSGPRGNDTPAHPSLARGTRGRRPFLSPCSSGGRRVSAIPAAPHPVLLNARKTAASRAVQARGPNTESF